MHALSRARSPLHVIGSRLPQPVLPMLYTSLPYLFKRAHQCVSDLFLLLDFIGRPHGRQVLLETRADLLAPLSHSCFVA